jgi:hypothetical protein
MPEVDFSGDPPMGPADPMDSSTPMDDYDADFDADFGSDDSVVDVPNIPLSTTDRAVITLIASKSEQPLATNEMIVSNPNARYSERRLIRLGLVAKDNGVLSLTQSGSTVAAKLGILDSSGTPTAAGKAAQMWVFKS